MTAPHRGRGWFTLLYLRRFLKVSCGINVEDLANNHVIASGTHGAGHVKDTER